MRVREDGKEILPQPPDLLMNDPAICPVAMETLLCTGPTFRSRYIPLTRCGCLPPLRMETLLPKAVDSLVNAPVALFEVLT